jgi:hypothetical protein
MYYRDSQTRASHLVSVVVGMLGVALVVAAMLLWSRSNAASVLAVTGIAVIGTYLVDEVRAWWRKSTRPVPQSAPTAPEHIDD